MAIEQYSFKDLKLASYVTLMDPSTMTKPIKHVLRSVMTCHYPVFKEGTSHLSSHVLHFKY